jgi:hypothetical protein
MKPLSPVDAVAPAFRRMRTILLPPAGLSGQAAGGNAPFRFWFFVKVAIIAALTQSSFYGAAIAVFVDGIFFALNFSGVLSGKRLPAAGALRFASPMIVAALIVAGALAVALWVFLGWIWSRLRFTLFDLVAYRHGRAGLAWSRYGAQAWRYLGMAILIALVFLLLLSLTAGPLILHLILTLRGMTPGQINADPFVILAHIFPLYGIIFLFSVLGAIADTVMQDFLLPPMAMEDAPVEQTAGLFLRLLRDHPGGVIVYALLRFAIQIGLGMAGGIAVFLVLGLAVAFGGGAGFVLYRGFVHAGPGGMAIFVLYCVAAGLAVAALYLLALVCIHGCIAVFKECYAVYFYGGYYPPLGSQMEPPPGDWSANPPPAPPPAPPFAPGAGFPAT